ncbi:MAG: hypothetical protein JWM85_1770 [Acidimicrobiaceae bacterium]|nr:hypothetical protein [Acidimicrobiaceae bacterium]
MTCTSAIAKPAPTPRRVRAVGLLLAGLAVSGAATLSVSSAGASARSKPSPASRPTGKAPKALPSPLPLHAFPSAPAAGAGVWHPAGRHVSGRAVVYETFLPLPDAPSVDAGVAWMDTSLLHARLYSGSTSPGGLFWKYTAPISATAARTLVAAFNGGYKLSASYGGYLSEGHLVAPLRAGAASLVIYANGRATVGDWGRDVTMTPSVVAVRQNLTLLVDHGHPVGGLNPGDTETWGSSLYQKPNTWRSGLGLTANGALVYVAGPMTIVDLADVLVRAGAVRAMTLDMNPLWPVFATYSPALPGGAASPGNGTDLLSSMLQTPERFFEPAYARDFITMSAG